MKANERVTFRIVDTGRSCSATIADPKALLSALVPAIASRLGLASSACAHELLDTASRQHIPHDATLADLPSDDVSLAPCYTPAGSPAAA